MIPFIDDSPLDGTASTTTMTATKGRRSTRRWMTNLPTTRTRTRTTTMTTILWMIYTFLLTSFILPVSIHCQDDPPSASTTTTTTNNTCTFDDGKVYKVGENVGNSFTTRCGNSTIYPCFCNPILTFYVYCPYCGFVTGDGSLYCSKDGEIITFPDGSITRQCSCDFDNNDQGADPIRNCTIIDDTGTGGGDDDENTRPTVGPSGPPMSNGEGRCVVPDEDNNLIEFENGESFGDLIEGACGPASEWPSFCLVLDESGANFDIWYPYCVFNDAESGETLCAKDGESISYVNVDGDTIKCTCEYTAEGGSNPDCRNTSEGSEPEDDENDVGPPSGEEDDVPTGTPDDRAGTPENDVPTDSTPSPTPVIVPSSSSSNSGGGSSLSVRPFLNNRQQLLFLPWLLILVRTLIL